MEGEEHQMAPKFMFTKDEITAAALNVTRENGLQGLTARSLAAELGCSVKPIFGLFRNMEEVQQEVLRSAGALCQSYFEEDMKKGEYPPYKAGGMAYIRFAKNEKELFKLLFMRDRSRERMQDNDRELQPLIELIMRNTGISAENARLLHLEMWICVHGIATMMATSYLDLDDALVSRVLTDTYAGLKYRYSENDSNDKPMLKEGNCDGSDQDTGAHEKI